MSILETPRILFRGNIAWDPIVTNNYQPLYDENLAQTQLIGADTVQESVQDFRSEAIADVMPNANLPRGPKGNWNPHGTHRSTFYDLLPGPDPSCPTSQVLASEVSGVDLGSGRSTDDPFVGSPARFTGMLVDLEPYGSQSSQLFFDSFTLGVEGGPRILARRNTRFTARYINFYRNPVFYTAGLASVIWQTCFPTADLQIDQSDSPALKALAAALNEPGVIGLTVRFTAYRTVYYDCPELATNKPLRIDKANALIAKLNAGGFQPNPARSKFVGVVGLWREGEPLHEPGDRPLLSQFTGPPPTPTIGTVYARLGADSISLDLGNAMPETGLDLAKHDWGPLDLCYMDDAGNPQTLATLTYDAYGQQEYEAGSGILTFPLTTDQATAAGTRDLQLRSGSTPMLIESRFRALPVQPNIYADQSSQQTVEFQIYDRGVPGGGGAQLSIYPLDFNGNVIGDPVEATADQNGLARIEADTTQGQVIGYLPVFGADAQPPPGTIQPLVTPYAYVRTLPLNSWMAELEPSWDNVYGYVLANWNAMAPCMDNWLRLDRPDQVYAYGKMLKTLTDPANFELFRYMPVTRDMTDGERKLLYAFLDGPKPSAQPEPLMAMAPRTAAPAGAAAPASRPGTGAGSIWTASD